MHEKQIPEVFTEPVASGPETMPGAPDALIDRVDQVLTANQTPEIPATEVDFTNESQRQAFFTNRWGTLSKAYSKAKGAFSGIKTWATEQLGIKVDNRQLTVGQNIRARLSMVASIPKMLQEPGSQRPSQNFDRYWDKLVVGRVRQERSEHSMRRSHPASTTGADYIKIAAYELLTGAIIRNLGVVALDGATKPFKGSRVNEWASNRSEVYRRGLHQPTIRKLEGFSRKDIKDLRKPSQSVSQANEISPITGRIYHQTRLR